MDKLYKASAEPANDPAVIAQLTKMTRRQIEGWLWKLPGEQGRDFVKAWNRKRMWHPSNHTLQVVFLDDNKPIIARKGVTIGEKNHKRTQEWKRPEETWDYRSGLYEHHPSEHCCDYCQCQVPCREYEAQDGLCRDCWTHHQALETLYFEAGVRIDENPSERSQIADKLMEEGRSHASKLNFLGVFEELVEQFRQGQQVTIFSKSSLLS